MSGIVVGYSTGQATPEAWRFIGDASARPPSPFEEFETYRMCLAPEGKHPDPAQELESALLRELGNFENLHLSAVASRLCALLPKIAANDKEAFAGVGGSWRIFTIWPDNDLGAAHIANPCSDPSAHSKL